MSSISCTYTGNGYAYTSVKFITYGLDFTIYAIPYENETLEDLIMTDQWDNQIAISLTEEQTISYDANWGNIYIFARFSENEPIPDNPPQPPLWYKFPWLIAKVAQQWRM